MTLQGVSFRYGPRAPLAVRDVSIDIKPGSTVAIVGQSGCGKSTLASLVAGLYRPVEGQILFDGYDLARLDLRSLRRQIGVVFQQPYLFAGSIRSNIALSDPEPAARPRDRRGARPPIHDDVDAMPMGYETLISERRLVALGRASASGLRSRALSCTGRRC